MLTRRSLLTVWCAALAAVVATSATAQLNAGEPKVRFAIVAAKDSPIGNISIYELKRLYMGERVELAGKRVIPLNQPPLSPSRVLFDQSVLGMSTEAAARYWIDRKIRGQSGPPKALDGADLLQRVVGRLDGAIGYVKADELRPDVKVVLVDGKSPKDPGYILEF